jgi:beta-glucosidase-like glycosyl hydrolase
MIERIALHLTIHRAALMDAVESGELSESQIDEKVLRILTPMFALGLFDGIATLAVASNMRELFRLVLVDTPLAPYFSENLTHEDPHQELRQALPYRGGGVGSGEVLAQCARATLIEGSGRRPPSS